MSKILFIANIPSPYRVDFFSKLGEQTDLTVWFENEKVNYREWKSNIEAGKFKYKFFNFNKNSKMKNILNLLLEFKKEKYDVYIVGGYSTPIGILSILYLKLTGRKFILNADGGFIKKDRKKIYIIKKLFISSANYWLSSGKNCTNYLIHYGAKKENIFEYPFASVDYSLKDLMDISEEEKNNLKQKNRLNDIVILSVGSFIDRKNIDILIKSFRILQQNCDKKNISLLLIGGGELKQKYESYIKENDIGDVTIIDFMDKDELIKYYKISDIFVLPTKEDIWGLVVNEAMSFGLPIIASSMSGAAHDLMVDGKNGFIFESENIEDLTNKLKILIEDKSIRKKFGIESNEIIKLYSSENMANEHKNIINELC